VEPLALVRFAGEILAPPRCAICASTAPAGELVCPRCEMSLRAARPGRAAIEFGHGPIGSVSWAARYEGSARELIAALKFQGRLGLADLAAAAIAAELRPPSDTCVVPVPAAPLRRWRRGFDPGELIALKLSARLELEFAPCLGRRNGRRQVGRRRAERLARAPRVRVTGRPPPRVLLVDDVLTTGATLGACAQALRGAGSAEIEAAVFARSFGGARPGA